MALQLNDFEGGGVAIGLSCTHMHGDLTSLILLFKAFSEAHHGQAITFPPFFKPPAPPDRKFSVNNSKSTSYLEAKLQKQTPSVKMSTATFKFSDSVVKQCLSEIHDKCPDASPFDLLAALFWIRVVHLKGPKHDDHTHSLSLCVDFRRLLQEPLPYGYFGNALNFSLLSLNEEEMDCSMLGRVAELVHCHVSGLKEEEFWATLHWLDLQKEEGGKYAPPFAMYGPEFTCVSMEHMIFGDQPVMYSMNFDSAKPVHVSCHVGNAEGEGLILVMPSAEAGLARTVMVTLPEEETAKLCEDQSILRLKPTMLLHSI